MSHHPLLPGEPLVCVASATPKQDPERNEDAGVIVCVPRFGLRGVAVADGLGSYSHAREAAQRVTRSAQTWLRSEAEDFGRGILPRLFADAHAELRSHAREAAGGGAPQPGSFGTTLLVALDAGAELVAAYAGNGAIWHLRGDLEANPSTGLPWNAVNLLNPHSVYRGGREVLYNLVDAAQERPPEPTLVSVRKEPRFGDILLLCTDGIYSADQVTHGLDAGGGVWIGAQATMLALHRALRGLFAAWDGVAELPLHDAIRACLDDLQSRNVLEDDATIGVIVTADALGYQRELQAARTVLAPGTTDLGADEGADETSASAATAGSGEPPALCADRGFADAGAGVGEEFGDPSALVGGRGADDGFAAGGEEGGAEPGSPGGREGGVGGERGGAAGFTGTAEAGT